MICLHVLEAREKRQGAGYRTFGICGRLVEIYIAQDKLDLAEGMAHRAWEGMKSFLGRDNPHTLGSMLMMAHVLRVQGKTVLAEKLGREFVAEHERLFGSDNSDTLLGIAELAITLTDESDNNRNEEATILFSQTLRGITRIHGPTHPNMIYIAGSYLYAMELAKNLELGKEYLDKLRIVPNNWRRR